MKRITAFVLAAVAVAACGETTTTSSGTAPLPATSDETVDTTPSTLGETAPTLDDAAVPPTDAPVPATDPPGSTPSEPPPTAAPPPPPTTGTPTSETVVVYGGDGEPDYAWAPLGWWDGDAWNAAGYDESFDYIDPPAATIGPVSATSLDLPDGPGAVIDGLSLGAPSEFCAGSETGPMIDLGVAPPASPFSAGYGFVAVNSDWPLQPRPVTQVGLENPVYKEAAIEALSTQFTPPTIDLGTVVQVVRVDIDGDGIEEVLATYEYITEPNFGAENDFTAVYARYASADGTVVEDLLAAYVLDEPVEGPTVGRFSIAAVADLNGDGVMEVALRENFWESRSMSIYEFVDGELTWQFGNGCSI